MKRAVVIGIDNYNIDPLDGCVNDANDIDATLSSSDFGFLVKKLVNEEATRKNCQQAIKWALEKSDFSIIYFAGHGKKADVSSYLLTIDAEDDDDGIEVDWLSKAVERLTTPDQNILILLDCCHSGEMPKPAASNKASYLTPSDIHSPPGVGRLTIAACRGEQQAHEHTDFGGVKRGKFTYYLSLALHGYAANDRGEITISAVIDYIASQFQDDKNQTPVFRGDHEGVMKLAEGVNKIGGWRQTTEDLISPERAVQLGEEYLGRLRTALISQSHDDWEKRGYLSACRVYEPISKWFNRVTTNQSTLIKDPKFGALFRNLQQYSRQLGTLTTGTVLSQGTVGDSLGFGTFGNVFKIVEESGDPKMCLKVFHANDLLDREKVGRFRRGYEAMRQMEHPNIVKVKELSEVPLGFFMDYIAGPNAREYLPGITNDPEQIIHLLLQVAETLNHAHGKKVVHRDVKPENILISISSTGESNAFLTDFDLAWFSTATKVTKLLEGFGSQFYAAPEQMTHPNSPAARSIKVDVYSFGQLCFFFLTGRDPSLDREANIKVLRSSLGQYWSSPNEASALLDFYSEATRVEADKRPSDFREICELLAKVELALTTTSEKLELLDLLNRLRFTLSGELLRVENPSVTSFRSRSSVTDVSIFLATESSASVSLEVSFRPDNIFMDGMRSQDARQVILQRADAATHAYTAKHGLRRSGAKGGQFELTYRIENIDKSPSGVLKAREIIAKIIDILEGR